MCGHGGIGRRATLRSLWAKARGSSSLLGRTKTVSSSSRSTFLKQGRRAALFCGARAHPSCQNAVPRVSPARHPRATFLRQSLLSKPLTAPTAAPIRTIGIRFCTAQHAMLPTNPRICCCSPSQPRSNWSSGHADSRRYQVRAAFLQRAATPFCPGKTVRSERNQRRLGWCYHQPWRTLANA